MYKHFHSHVYLMLHIQRLLTRYRVTTSSSEALDSILDRLRRLEAHSTSSPSYAAITAAAAATFDNPASPAALIPSPAISVPEHDSSTCVDTSVTTPSHGHRKGFDVNEVMLDATNRVQKLRLQSFGSSAIADPITIPKEMAKHCVASTGPLAVPCL